MPSPTRRRAHRIATTWNRLPLRARLVAGFAAAMLLVLTGAGAFVYLRVRYALDLRLDEDLAAESAQLRNTAAARMPPALPPGTLYQILDAHNQVIAGSSGLTGASLLGPDQTAIALHRPVRADRGRLFPINTNTLRLYAVPIRPGATTPAPSAVVAVVAVRRDQRDEALRELIAQLTLANLAALAIASLVGYRLARAALTPVERYRTEAARIAAGAIGIRLAVPADSHDEVARLGHTLNTMLAALETALERERRFVNDASHELRTPLTLLSGELELALRRPRSAAELEETIKAAAADTADLSRLAEALLTVGVPPDPAHAYRVDLRELLTGLVARYRTATPDAGPELRIAAGAGLAVHGDAIRLEQVVTNLLDNTARHGAPPVTVTGDRTGELIRVTVHDRGTGMTPDYLSCAADRFSRADTARSTPGTGLGLSLVDAVVTSHHGELRVCSRGAHHRTTEQFELACTHPEAGTTITVLLPAAGRPDDPGSA
jgi:two-component system OmpR family sensor kinase